MQRRWIIRGFFIGVLLLCVGAWVLTEAYSFHAAYFVRGGGHRWDAACGARALEFHWQWGYPDYEGWNFWIADVASGVSGAEGGWLGFHLVNDPTVKFLTIPLWSIMMVTGVAAVLAWRRTRTPVKGRAFPVGADPPASVAEVV